ncbi:MAG: peptidoglycan DD-metalloendopeptidase family protein [Patescibacteria group bacterium]|nr:MAG: peptidoglycan DD-metalloendopeptidase family protein [Patescibacteria group bacterium]
MAVPFVFLWKVFLRRAAFLAYQALLRLKISATTFLPPMRRTFFAIFGHRYVVHAVVAVIAVFVSTSNIYAHSASTDAGQEVKQAMFFDLFNVSTDEYISPDSNDVNAESQLNMVLDGSATSTPIAFAVPERMPPSTYDQSGVAVPGLIGGTDEPVAPEDEQLAISKPSIYVVQQGDTVSSIAQRYGVSVNTILWANNLTARSVLRLGQKLTILPVTGVLHTVKRGETLGGIAKQYGSDVERILAVNRVSSPSQIQIGEELVIPEGRPPVVARAPAPAAPPRLGDVRDVFKPPVEAPPNQVADGVDLVWPTDQKRINQYFKARHSGLDINGTLSNAVYSVDAGIVTFSGWNSGGYGNMILVDHGNGMITRYAHHSKLFVKVGDQVTKGQTIGMVGSTGRSTGPHLHFELYVNGRRVNPLTYYK